MPLQLSNLQGDHPDLAADGSRLRRRILQLEQVDTPRLRRLWDYYRNPMTTCCVPDGFEYASTRPYRQAQEWGLPTRILGDGAAELGRKEVVIENDIGWRVDAMVDFLFGQPISIQSALDEGPRRRRIESVLRQVFAHNGGIAFLQKLSLLSAVYGYVDVLVKYVPTTDTSRQGRVPCETQPLGDRREAVDVDAALASCIRFEIVEPTRALPMVCDIDQRVVAYAQHYHVDRPARPARRSPWIDSLRHSLSHTLRRHDAPVATRTPVLEIISATHWQRYESEELVAEGDNSLGRVPLVHIQNAALPFEYAGASDVEPLIPLQDELNTRLSDRAYRITMQSAKMYLGKGIDNFDSLPIAPNRMYSTDNVDAEIIEFGGDSAAPSEQNHIDEIREALDKASGVSPVAAGAVKGRIGQLTSAAALRITMQALLSRTERKRTSFGPAIAQLSELALAWLDLAGRFRTSPAERRVHIEWPDPVALTQRETSAARAE
jgi:Phage portal protein, SPP1 Gp6-like